MARSHRLFAALYDRLMEPAERQGLGVLRADLLGSLTGDVCEVGAGTGRNLDHYGPVHSLALVEPDPAMGRRLQERLARSALAPAATVVLGTLESASFPAQSFDTVVCTLVLCSARQPAALLEEVRRVVRPGGSLVVIEHVLHSKRAAAFLQRALTPLQRMVAGGCHLDRATGRTIEAAGFDVTGLREVAVFSRVSWLATGVAGVARPR